MIDLDKIHSEMTEEQVRELTRLRGCCACHISPPCSACCDPLTLDEALTLGLVPEVGT